MIEVSDYNLYSLLVLCHDSLPKRIKKWQTYWNQFESIFVQAGKAAHLKVITHATNLTIRVWPYLPYIPDLVENPTLAQEIQFKREFIQWSRNHSMTIPRIKMDLEAKYMDMQNDETMRALWQGKDQSTFGNDSIVLFEQLGRVFSYQSSLPNYCSEWPLSSNLNRFTLIFYGLQYQSTSCQRTFGSEN